jgi:hypothetical protein
MITYSEGRGLAWIEEYASSLITSKLPAYILGTAREHEAGLTRATFIAALSESNFRSGRFDASTYERAIADAFPPLSLDKDPEGLCEYAEALIAFNDALSSQSRSRSSASADSEAYAAKLSESEFFGASRWKALTTALDALTAASKLNSAVEKGAYTLAKIHLMRGDVELLRFQLGQGEQPYPVASKNAAVLLKNAGTYYRGAEAHAGAVTAEEEAREAGVKKVVVEALGGEEGRGRL